MTRNGTQSLRQFAAHARLVAVQAFLVAGLVWTSSVTAETEAADSPPAKDADLIEQVAAGRASPILKQQSDHVFLLGTVQIDRRARTVSFPAMVNMTEGLIEYWCTAGTEKLHECFLRTDTNPAHIHLAALLLSAPGQLPEPGAVPDPSIPDGEPIPIRISWNDGEEARSGAAEAFVLDIQTGAAMTVADGAWSYTSSRIDPNRRQGPAFMAAETGIIVALMENPDALINCRDPRRADDELWHVNSAQAPPVGTDVRVILELPARPLPRQPAAEAGKGVDGKPAPD